LARWHTIENMELYWWVVIWEPLIKSMGMGGQGILVIESGSEILKL
jgi:hypothetical protein